MRYKYALTAVLLFVFFSGCATVQLGGEILDFRIKPEKGIKPGTIMTVTVKAGKSVKKVEGYLDIIGSPKVPLRYNKEKDVWEFKYMIPITVKLPKGEFTAKVEAITNSGKKYRAEKKISTY